MSSQFSVVTQESIKYFGMGGWYVLKKAKRAQGPFTFLQIYVENQVIDSLTLRV